VDIRALRYCCESIVGGTFDAIGRTQQRPRALSWEALL
jgi:hypothetical protein